MTIAIDASRAINETAGIGRLTKALVEHLLEAGKGYQFILIFTYWRADQEKEKMIKSFQRENVIIRTAKIPGSLKETLWRKKSKLYNRLYQGADVILAPSFLEYKKGLSIPQVTMIHDMTTFLFPGQRGEAVSRRLSHQAEMAIRESAKIITISKSTKKDIIRLTRTPADKISVVYPGVTKWENRNGKCEMGNAKGHIFFVGTIEPRKNLRGLLTAYGLLTMEMRKKYPLVIAGANGWNNDEELKAMDNIQGVKWLGFVGDDIIAKLYQEAAVFVYPSLYEGFGLPILEAMQMGTPVITSDRSAMPEAAGSAGVLINPDKPESIAEGIRSVLGGKISRTQLVKAGIAQAKKFSWEKAAQEVLKVLENI